MDSVNLVVIVEGTRTLLTHTGSDTNALHIPSLVAVAAALGEYRDTRCMHADIPTGVKLLLFLYCFGLRTSSSQVRMLWEDHRNDLWINTFGEYSFE